MGAHVHIGVYPSGVPAVLFKQEGLTPATKKEYSIETMPFPTPAN
jgi:hypothetical protein